MLTISEFVIQELRPAKEETELRDGRGKVIGRLIPLIPELPLHHALSDEEYARRTDPNPKAYTSAEVIAYMTSLTLRNPLC